MATELPFQLGETVKHLHPNSPTMVVVWVDELVTCEWFNKLDLLERADFQPFLLTAEPTMLRKAG